MLEIVTYGQILGLQGVQDCNRIEVQASAMVHSVLAAELAAIRLALSLTAHLQFRSYLFLTDCSQAAGFFKASSQQVPWRLRPDLSVIFKSAAGNNFKVVGMRGARLEEPITGTQAWLEGGARCGIEGVDTRHEFPF